MWATWTDISEFTRKRNLMCVPTVERDSTRPPPCKTTKKSTPPMSLASVLSAQRSSRRAGFCWSIYELFIFTPPRVSPRLVLPSIAVESWWSIANIQFDARLPAIVCCSHTRNMQTWWLPKLKKKCQPNASTAKWDIMIFMHVMIMITWSHYHDHIIQHSISGLWQSILIQASVTEPHDRGTWWTGGFSLQVNHLKNISFQNILLKSWLY